MGIIKRQSIKSTIYIYFGVLIGFAYTAILMPDYLSQSEIGALNLIVSYALIFSQIGSLGFHIATIKFFPFFKNKEKHYHGFLSISTLVGIIGTIVITIIFFALRDWLISKNIDDSPIFANYIYLILPVSAFMIFMSQYDAYARSLYYSTTGTFLNEFGKRIFIFLVIVLFITNLINQKGLFILYSLALISPTILLISFLIFKKEFDLHVDFSLLNKSFVKEMATVSGLGLLTGFGVLAIAQIDRLMVNHFLDEAATGVYSVTFYFGALVSMPSRAVMRIAPSLIANAFKNKDMETINEIYKKSCIMLFIIAIFLFLLLWLNINNVFKIIPKDYLDGKYVIFYIALSNVITMAGGMSGSIIGNSKYYFMNTIFIAVFLILIIISNIVFIPQYGIAGAALASALSTLFFIIIKFLFLKLKFNLQPYNYKYFYIMVIAGVTFFLVSLIPEINNLYLSIFIISLATLLIFLPLIYFIRVSDDFNEIIEQYVKKFFNRY